MPPVLRARVSVLMAGALASAGVFFGITAARMDEGPRWQCSAEDMVVVIDHTCRHIDMLTHEDLRRFEMEGVKP